MSSLQRSIKRKYNKQGGKCCPRCGHMLLDYMCKICGWTKKSFAQENLDMKAKMKRND